MKLLCLLLCHSFCWQSLASPKPRTNCPDYVPENNTLSCQCLNPAHMIGTAQLTWPEHSNTANLHVEHVQREKNGTQFRCQMKDGDFNESTHYTLRVAYGPLNDNIHIDLTQTVNMTTGVPTFQLTCLATDVYPTPHYSWDNVTCNNGYNNNTCTFTPGPNENSTHPTCTAESPDIHPYEKQIAKSESPPLKLMYEAKVAALTINETKGTFTVNGEDHANLSLMCKAYGRPLPIELNFTKLGNDDFTITNTTIEKGEWSVEAAVTLSDIQCRDMGTYSCKAHNGVGLPDTRSIMLNVRCPPQAATNKTMHMDVGTSTSFLLEAYPAPDNFTFTHLYNETSTEGRTVPSTTFLATCTQQPVEQFMVRCEITHLDTSERLLGFYCVSISNDLGSVEVKLLLGPEDNFKKKVFAGLLFVGLPLFVLITLIVIVIVLKKRRPTSRSNRKRKQTNCNDVQLIAPPAPHSWRRKRTEAGICRRNETIFQEERPSFGSERTHSYVDIPDDDTTIISRSIASLGSSFGSDCTVFYGHRTHNSNSSSLSSNESESYCHAYGFSLLDNSVQGNNTASMTTSQDPTNYLHPIPSRLEAAAPPWTTSTPWTSGGNPIVPEMAAGTCCSGDQVASPLGILPLPEDGSLGTSTDLATGMTAVRRSRASPDTSVVIERPPQAAKDTQTTESQTHEFDTVGKQRHVATVVTIYTGEFGAAFYSSSQSKPLAGRKQ